MEYTRKVGGGAGPDGLPGAGPERTLAFGAVFLPRADAKDAGDKGAPAQDNVLHRSTCMQQQGVCRAC